MKKLNLALAAGLCALVCTANEASAQASVESRAAAGADEQQWQTIEFLGLQAQLPAAWIEQQVSSSMRMAQFLVPGANGEQDAQFVVFYFGQGQGGSVADNIARWQSQFSTADKMMVTPTVETLLVEGMSVTIAEFTGNYARNTGMGQAGKVLLGQTLIAAVVETPRGNLYIQLHGPAASVSMQRDAYLAFINGICIQSED